MSANCVKLPTIPIPVLPLPFTLTPPLFPPIDIGIDFCCKFSLVIPLPQIPLPPLVVASPEFSAIMLAMTGVLEGINAFFDSIPLKCPFE